MTIPDSIENIRGALENIRGALNELVVENERWLQDHEAPKLYESSIKFHTSVEERHSMIPEILSRGTADACDLAIWRCAELLKTGKKASIRLSWWKMPTGGTRVRVLVLVDGLLEDPVRMILSRPQAVP